MSFIEVWIIYAVFGVTVFSAVFVWAVRARQFTDLDRARYIALRIASPLEADDSGRRPSRIDSYTWIALAVMAALLLAAAVWLGLMNG